MDNPIVPVNASARASCSRIILTTTFEGEGSNATPGEETFSLLPLLSTNSAHISLAHKLIVTLGPHVMDQNSFFGRNGVLTRGISAGVVLLEPKECHYCAMLETIRDLDGLRQIWTGLDRFGRAWTDFDGLGQI